VEKRNAPVQEQIDRIRKALEGHAARGLSLNELTRALGDFEIPPRTLSRRLQELADKGEVLIEGVTKGARYRLKPETADPHAVALSPAGAKIEGLLAIPAEQRLAVGYNRALLDAYRPNDTFYLTAAERKKLAEIGRSPVSGAKPAGTYARNILNRLLVDLSWNSSRLEGNTYSLLDTQRLIAFGKVAAGKSLQDAQMILNHKNAIEFLVTATEPQTFNRYTILNLHALLAEGLLGNPRAAGRIRNIAVAIGGSAYTPLAVPAQIEETFDAILAKASVIKDPYEQSFFALVHLPYLQPFEDVNKRVSRLAANIPFLNRNLSPLSFIDVPEQTYINGMLGVYEFNKVDLLKDVFIWAYERSANQYALLRHTLGQPDPFRVRYRNLILGTVGEVVRGPLGQAPAKAMIDSRAAEVRASDRARFIETVETELLALHEGNIAPYKILPSEFKAWQKVWSKG